MFEKLMGLVLWLVLLMGLVGRFRAANIKLNPKKCELFGQKVLYLGHIVTPEGISTEPSKVEAVIT